MLTPHKLPLILFLVVSISFFHAVCLSPSLFLLLSLLFFLPVDFPAFTSFLLIEYPFSLLLTDWSFFLAHYGKVRSPGHFFFSSFLSLLLFYLVFVSALCVFVSWRLSVFILLYLSVSLYFSLIVIFFLSLCL